MKRIARRAAGRLRRWLAEPPVDPRPDLNASFTALLADTELTASAACRVRQHYTWGVLQSALEARALGIDRITAIEFGVAAGEGLRALELIARRVGVHTGVRVAAVGFDTGHGLPKSGDWRDLPNLFQAGEYAMDRRALMADLADARLVLGDVHDTVPRFLADGASPVGFVVLDLDYYTSTVEALRLFDGPVDRLLPRVYIHVDDMLGYTFGMCNGPQRAIAEYNAAHATRAVARIEGLRFFLPTNHRDARWLEKMFIAHIGDHPHYRLPSIA